LVGGRVAVKLVVGGLVLAFLAGLDRLLGWLGGESDKAPTAADVAGRYNQLRYQASRYVLVVAAVLIAIGLVQLLAD
jgi:hypothetical protein